MYDFFYLNYNVNIINFIIYFFDLLSLYSSTMSDLLASIQQGLGLNFELSSKRTIGIARVTGKVKSRYVVRIELNFLLPSANKIRCRDKVSTHGNQHLVIFISLFYGKCAIITARAHKNALPDTSHKRVATLALYNVVEITCSSITRLNKMNVSKFFAGISTFLKLTNNIGVLSNTVIINLHVINQIPRRKPDADAASTQGFNNSVNNLESKARAVFNRTAVLISTFIRVFMNKLIKQIAIGRVDLDTIGTSINSIFCGLNVGFNVPFNFFSIARSL